jgi:hypothetical protein
MARELLPNSTQIPDVILDFWLSALSGAELKVVLYVARRTYGFGKESDKISLNQMAEGIQRRDGIVLDRGTGLSRSTVKAACASLVERGMLMKTTNLSEKTGEFAESTYRLNLDWTPPGSETDPSGGVGRKSAHAGQKALTGAGRKSAQVGQSAFREVGRKSALQETEDIQETAGGEAAAGKSRRRTETELSPAAALLVEKLVSHNLNRCDAICFALEEPEECERQLQALKFLPPREDEGRWLARAIPGHFGLPGRFRKKQESKKHEEANRRKEAIQKAKLDHQQAFWEPYMNYLRQSRQSLKESHFEAYRGFEEQERRERDKYVRFGLNGTLFDKEAEILQRFQAFFADFPSSPILDFWQWDETFNQRSFREAAGHF